MINKKLRVLNVEDSERDVALLKRYLSRAGYDVFSLRVDLPGEMREALEAQEWDVILCDYSMPHFNALEALRLFKKTRIDIPFIVISGAVGETVAVEVMRAGAQDYLMKDSLTRLAPSIERELEEKQDRDARRRAVEELREKEEKLKQLQDVQASILDALPAHICLLDNSGKIVTVNAGWRHFAQANDFQGENDGIGTNYLEVCARAVNLGTEFAGDIAVGIRDVLSGASGHFEFEYPCLVLDEVLWYRLMVSPLHINGTTGATVMHIDDTERRKAEESLRQAEAKYRNLVESLPGIVYLAEASPPFKPLYVSSNIVKFGYTVEEWNARSDFAVNLVHPEDIGNVLQKVEDAASRGLETDLEYRLLSRDGETHWVHDKGCLVADEDGKRLLWQGIIIDITETRALEERFRQAQKLESVGRLAGGIAHDFNNMLTAIIGYSEMILKRPSINDDIRLQLGQIKKAAARSADLTRQLLAFSRKQILLPVVVDLNYLITDTVKILERVIGEDIHLMTLLDSRIGRVKVDPGQFSQILMNLGVNARDAMPKGGSLEIKTGSVRFDAENLPPHLEIPAGAYISLTVSDTGCGMTGEVMEHIFEPFFTTKKVGQGTGLGLSTVYGIIKQSGGDIEVFSEEGCGTSFTIYLPQVEEPLNSSPVRELQPEALQGTETILLVEDETLVRNLAKNFLEEFGYTAIVAENGKEALKLRETGKINIDLLITDIVMPQMGGYELARKIRAESPNLPIIYISGYCSEDVAPPGDVESGTKFIQKPFSLEFLAGKVREILDRR